MLNIAGLRDPYSSLGAFFGDCLFEPEDSWGLRAKKVALAVVHVFVLVGTLGLAFLIYRLCIYRPEQNIRRTAIPAGASRDGVLSASDSFIGGSSAERVCVSDGSGVEFTENSTNAPISTNSDLVACDPAGIAVRRIRIPIASEQIQCDGEGYPGRLSVVTNLPEIEAGVIAVDRVVFEDANVSVTWAMGDMVRSGAKVIVNAANTHLRVTGNTGVNGMILRDGGVVYRAYHQQLRNDFKGQFPSGWAARLPSGSFRDQGVPLVYVVAGPNCQHSNVGPIQKQELFDCYYNCLVLAHLHEDQSIAFPGISEGVYGFPKDLAASIRFAAICQFVAKYPKTPVRNIYLVTFAREDSSSRAAARAEIQQIFPLKKAEVDTQLFPHVRFVGHFHNSHMPRPREDAHLPRFAPRP